MPPLAEILRPQSLNEFIGQDHLVGKNMPIRQMIESDTLYSLIFWGPPGCGKTTLARIIAKLSKAKFHYLSAVSAGKSEVRTICEQADLERLNSHREQKLFASENSREIKRTVIFLDEIHRFNKLQQDFLLPYVERGTITLIGATTENPSFEVNSALLSRSQVYVLKALTPEEILLIINQTIKKLNFKIDKKAKLFISEFSNGDARVAIGAIQIAREFHIQFSQTNKPITLEQIKTILQSKSLKYDKGADQHYDTISAFIKSMRASNIDSALYYLARMVDSGEDPKFIARRMVVFASEDIGVAQPTALVVANAVFRAVETIGYPEAQINLAHGVAYLCQAKKDRSAHDAYFKALDDVKKYGNLPIPMNLRNAPTKLMKELGYGKGYEKYSKQSYLPEKLKGKKYYK